MYAHLHLNGTAAGHNTLALDATLHTIKTDRELDVSPDSLLLYNRALEHLGE
jgi:hypothetical protein